MTGSDAAAGSAAWRAGLLVLVALLMAGIAAALPPIPQDPAYHAFADQRAALGVPHFLNVVSNLPFLVVGALGLALLARRPGPDAATAFLAPADRRPYWALFAGIGLTGVGSAYYHWMPEDRTLFWDRLPMSVAFAALLAAVIGERVSRRAGAWLLGPLLAAGVGSTVSWHLGAQAGGGDLRAYGLVQFGSAVLIGTILALYPARYTGTRELVTAMGWYGLAKGFEHLDRGLYELTGVSGHTLKHLAAAAGAYWLVRMLAGRRALAPARQAAVP